MFSYNLKELRKNNKMTQKEFSKILNVSQQTIGSWEVGRAEPNTEMLKKIANYFNVSTDYLIGNTIVNKINPQVLELNHLLVNSPLIKYKEYNLSPNDREAIDNMIAGYFWNKISKENKKS